MKYLYIALRVIASLILLQTLFLKFSGAEKSIAIHKKDDILVLLKLKKS